MYLKSIEVYGFKSFANKIVFQFHNGITGIVGPNGSGKSNVADAVRWVLGEQKVKQLRSSNMQDVIFSGTEMRKPMSYASVAITIDNADHQLDIAYEEVTVTRRLFRSGESEYLLNGSQCRLRDIHELFYDTGIGKEGYSIIGQGQIDKILSGKPEDRRELFDEAAGIVKFKRRKEVAQKKLENEKASLTRTNDIIAEIEKRLKPLEKQAETAKIYLKKRDELKSCDVNMFLLELERIKKTTEEVSSKLAEAEERLHEANDAYARTKQEYDRIEAQAAGINEQLEEKRIAQNDATVRREQLDGRVNLLKEQIRSAKQSDENLAERLRGLRENKEQRLEEQAAFEKEREENRIALQELEEKEKEHQTRLESLQKEIAAANTEIEASQAEIMELLNRNASLKAEEQKYDTMLDQVRRHGRELSQQSEDIRIDTESAEREIKHRESYLEEIAGRIRETDADGKRLDVRLSEIKGQMQECNENLQKKQELYLKKHSQLETLTNMAERYEGYGNSIRRVMEKKDTHKGIIGVVADIIQTEKKYETAIETALGGSIQNIVTEDEETAKEMIRYLKTNKFGRATFLPLTSIRGQGQKKREDVLKEKGVIANAQDLVVTAEKHNAVKEYLLGRIFVVDHMDNAVTLARKYNYTLRIVTLDGELLNPGGSMTGGAFKHAGNLLGRQREIEELKKTTQRLQKETAALQQQIADTKKERDQARTDKQTQQEMLQKYYLQQNSEKLRLNEAIAKLKSLQEQSADVSAEKDNAALQQQAILSQKERIAADSRKAQERQETLQQQIDTRQALLESLNSRETEDSGQAVSFRLEISNATQKAEFIEQNLTRLSEELSSLKEQQQTLEEAAEDSKGEARQKEQELEALLKAIETANVHIDALGKELAALQQQKEKLTADNHTFFDKREELAEQISLLDKETYRLSSQKDRLEETKEEQISYMWEEYELTFSSAAALYDEAYTNLNDLKKRSREIKEEIRTLGSVNVNAIEEYKETSERYTFLKTQRDDLVEAEEALLKIIEELDQGMRKQFTERFAQIGVEFDKAFKDLFGGGKGSLELVEDEDVLDAGIRIISQPPGKKLQNMMQLSGGEKALTAIALLFAIQNLKPSPFCLLDEIEAALDDSNVDRFAKYLHKLTKHTQFIVITHRRGTMAAADRLYGITMQEKGVSTLVSVNLIEEQLTD